MNDFYYYHPSTLREASELLCEPASLPIAGGTDLLDLIKSDIESPASVVDLKSIPGLSDVVYRQGRGLEIGALTTVSELAGHEVVRDKYRALSEAASQVGSPQLRNVGTVGGNLCQRPRCAYFRGEFNCLRKGGDLCYAVDGDNKRHCVVGGGPCVIVHPSDLAVALLALEAEVEIFSGKKSRQVPLSEFYLLPERNVRKETMLEPGDIVTRVFIPEPVSGIISGYLKFREREAWDFAVVSVAAVLERSNGRIQSGRIALGGVAPVPWLEKNAGGRIIGVLASTGALDQIAASVLTDADVLEGNKYKIPLARNLVKRLLGDLVGEG